jgi:hypothetical protein
MLKISNIFFKITVFTFMFLIIGKPDDGLIASWNM